MKLLTPTLTNMMYFSIVMHASILSYTMTSTVDAFTTGISLSSGGLLLPYHLGVLDALRHKGVLTPNAPIAGSSAGAIATACVACQVDSLKVLDATIEISDRCAEMGGARGRLLPLLREKLHDMICEDRFETLQKREGETIIAYKEIFPRNRAILQKEFETKEDLFTAVCHSSTFPFFATNWPVSIEHKSGQLPRLLVDGFFSVPRKRHGCPDFEMAKVNVDRTLTVCVFPKDFSGLNEENCICPESEGLDQVSRLLRIATQPSSRKELTSVYESGWIDAERWYHNDKLQRDEELIPSQ